LDIGLGAFGFDRAAGGQLAGFGSAIGLSLELIGGVEAAVGETTTEVFEC